MNILHPKKLLSTVVSIAVCQSVTTQASDIEIYSANTDGKVTLMLAIDTSRSMEEADDHDLARKDFGIETTTGTSGTACFFGTYDGRDSSGQWKFQNRTLKIESKTRGEVTYKRKYCQVAYSPSPSSVYQKNKDNGQCEVLPSNGGLKCYDRLTLVKDGLFDLLLGSEDGSIVPVTGDKIIGLSHFSVIGSNAMTNNTQQVRGASIAVPARPLSEIVNGVNHRKILLQGVANLEIDGAGGTPSSALLAETAAYMMGTTTVTSALTAQENFRYDSTSSTPWKKCKTLNAASGNLQTCSIWENFTLSSNSYARTASNGNQGSKNHYLNEFFRPTRYANGFEYYIGTNSNRSGFFNSVVEARSGTNYIAPASIRSQASATEAEKACNGQGIYFLTDGDYTDNINTNDMMRTALGTHGSSFSCSSTGNCFANTIKSLFDASKNPAGLSFRIATVGFGKDINNVSTYDGTPLVVGQKKADGTLATAAEVTANIDRNINAINNATSASAKAKETAIWGINGRGGWYSGNSSTDVVDSINKFIDTIAVEMPTMTTGSPTIPQDALNPLRVQPYGYYASFDPKPSQSLWVGNMNKYHVVNGKLVGSDEETSIFKTDGSLNSTVMGLWLNGFKGTLELGANGEKTQFVRNVLTNRVISDSGSEVSEGNSLSNVALGSDYLTTDPKQRYWLNLLGYDVDTSVTTVDPNLAANYITATANLRQVGATMHSTPILLTQSGTIASDLTTTNRKDYLLFGTTQGLLHVVDSKSGKEVFAFAPHEMMERQPKALIEESKAGSGALFYGIDAPWAAYTEYVNNKNGSLTVGQSDYSSTERNKLTGKQWVYGGLRMGGQSYYALDLSNISSPVLKFHIDPANQTIHYGAYKDANNNDVAAGEHSNVGALSYMGDSWSKPTLAYVNFGGEKKLVMFVGGGYDEGYEAPDYNPTTATKGTGVYMFDANNGKLLWWTGVNATTKGGAEAYTTSTDMKYSMVSQINAIDRDNDGLVDNLYFGDLGGQAFRVDLNNAATGTGDNAAVKLESQKTNFATRVVLLTSRHAGGASPRFYEMPSFSVHRDSSLGLYGVVALSSGNRSSPLAGVVSTNNPSASTSANDGVFVVFDKDVGRTDLYTLTDSGASALKTKNVTLANLKSTYSTTGVAPTQAGWYYSYGTEDTEAGVYKGMNSIYAVDSILYANVFHRDGKGIGGGCGAGVKGDSYLYRFCLPSGSCSGRFNGADGKPIAEASPQSVALGAGILGSALGGASELKNIAPSTTDCNIAENKNKIECQAFTTAGKIRTLRWYETR